MLNCNAVKYTEKQVMNFMRTMSRSEGVTDALVIEAQAAKVFGTNYILADGILLRFADLVRKVLAENAEMASACKA